MELLLGACFIAVAHKWCAFFDGHALKIDSNKAFNKSLQAFIVFWFPSVMIKSCSSGITTVNENDDQTMLSDRILN